MKSIKEILPRAALFVFIFTLLCGAIYTGFVTVIAQIIFPDKANGSIIEIEGKRYGSELLGQQFTHDNHMWGRIMNIDTQTFVDEEGNALMYSVPSNISPASEEYEDIVADRVAKIKRAHPENEDKAIPVDLVTSSGSGLDPHISIAAANYQIERLAKNNNMTIQEIQNVIDECTTDRFLGIFGEPTVNVLMVNLILEGIL